MHVGTMHVGTMHVGTMHVGTMHAGLYSNNVRGINILGGVDSGFLFQISPGSNAYPAARLDRSLFPPISNVRCTGSELKLTGCVYDWNVAGGVISNQSMHLRCHPCTSEGHSDKIKIHYYFLPPDRLQHQY